MRTASHAVTAAADAGRHTQHRLDAVPAMGRHATSACDTHLSKRACMRHHPLLVDHRNRRRRGRGYRDAVMAAVAHDRACRGPRTRYPCGAARPTVRDSMPTNEKANRRGATRVASQTFDGLTYRSRWYQIRDIRRQLCHQESGRSVGDPAARWTAGQGVRPSGSSFVSSITGITRVVRR